MDCNGNIGEGFYCYCPSQGYSCECDYDDFFEPGVLRDMCFDHYGYTCEGEYIDGEENWCTEIDSVYYRLNFSNQ